MFQNVLAKRRRGEAGFTLVELLVVIVILAILAAVVVFAVGGITDKGQESACEADTSALQTAEEAYFADDNHSVYVNEATLVTEKFLAKQSKLHDITVTGGGSGYTIVDVAPCTDNTPAP